MNGTSIHSITRMNYVFVRGMARGAKRIESSTNNGHLNSIVADKISKVEKEIVFGSHNILKNIHHDKKGNFKNFESLHLRNDVIKALESLDVVHPTVIQTLAIPPIMEKKNVFCAAQTGSGKTLVYAAPIVSHLKDESENGFINRLSRPRALVIAPSRELASQILGIFKHISHHAPIRSLGLIGQKQKKWTNEYLKGIVDVVVGTPNTILKYHQRGRLLFSDLRYLVFDEADTMMDENFRKVTTEILQHCQFVDSKLNSRLDTQAILTAATLPPKGVLGNYRKHIADLDIVQSNLHKVLPHIKHVFIKTTENQKIDLVVKKVQFLLKKSNRKFIVFCNKSKACNFVSIKLSEAGIFHSKIHGNMNPKIRFQDYDKFIKNETRVLVCTDVASRGLDSTEITCVLNYDCPFNTTDYLHRAGRTGRATELFPGEGEIRTYITQNKQVAFARKIEDAATKNKSLDSEIQAKKNSSKTRYEKRMDEAVKEATNSFDSQRRPQHKKRQETKKR